MIQKECELLLLAQNFTSGQPVNDNNKLSLTSLPTDVLLIITNYMDIYSFVSLSNTSVHLKNVLNQLSVWKTRYERSFRCLWGQDQISNTKEDWYTKCKQEHVKCKSIAVIYAYNKIYDHSGKFGVYSMYLHRTCELLSSYGFNVIPIQIHQPDFNESDLKTVTSNLEQVSAVLFYSAGYFSTLWDELGNVMASYVDTGRCVVVGTYGNCTIKEAPGGAWRDRDLNPIGMQGQKEEIQTFTTKAEDGIHPMLTGVDYFTTMGSIATGPVKKGSEVIAWYNSGRPMAVWMQETQGAVLSLNFMPTPGKANMNIEVGWDEESNSLAGRMLANAMWWALNNDWAKEQLRSKTI